MGGEKFTYSIGKKTGTWAYQKAIKGATWSFITSQKAGNAYTVNLGQKAPSWNQSTDERSSDWVRTWDWVFLTSSWSDLSSENWEDWK